ncbi:hypothetical protein, partial [Subtercola vilae]
MRIKITLTRPGGSQVDLAVTADATTSVSNIAEALFVADPTNAVRIRPQAQPGTGTPTDPTPDPLSIT